MNYRWTVCPACQCEIAVNYLDRETGVSGSLRRWSHDRSVNDGRAFEIKRADVSSTAGFSTPCVCGQPIAVPSRPDATGGQRDEGLRVSLGE
jgi:hypothetical protein